MRIVVVIFLLGTFSLAQAATDFSGVFLRANTVDSKGHTSVALARIIEVKQAADDIAVTATQDGETATVHYPLNAGKTGKVRAQIKGGSLVIKATVTRRFDDIALAGSLRVSDVVEQDRRLSADGQQLTIRTKPSVGIGKSDIYTRQPSVEVARIAASSAHSQNCNQGLVPTAPKHKTGETQRYNEGTELGTALLAQLTRCVGYDSVLSGDFFKELKRTKAESQVRFQKAGRVVSTYTGELVLEVQSRPLTCFGEVGTWMHTGAPLPEAVQHLRFMVRWLGAEQWDMGEVPSEFLYEPWREGDPLVGFYRMRVSGQDIPLTDDLEVTIFSETGEELACIKGHI